MPAVGAVLAHAPVLRWDLAQALKRPISRRLFGQNKTWRGALVMTGGTVATTVALYRLPAYRRRLPEPVTEVHPGVVGLLLGLAMWIGELPNSFVKRRLGIPPGQRLDAPFGVLISVWDQADWVPLSWLLLRPIWPMSVGDGVKVFTTVAVVHVPINLIGYALGVRTTPI